MRITFLGANHEVTGSCTLLEVNGHHLLIDRGMEQGENEFENAPLPVAPAQIEIVLLTHAHIDHTGLLPLLYKQGFRGSVCATAETCRLAEIMLKDSAHIQESDATYKTRKALRAGQPLVEPLYTLEDVAGLLPLFHPCPMASASPFPRAWTPALPISVICWAALPSSCGSKRAVSKRKLSSPGM